MTDKWFGLTPEQVNLLKKLYPTAPEEQLRLFVYRAKKAGLDPLTNQIHLLERKRWNRETAAWESTWSIQTGIDGLRAAADRTGAYVPGAAPEITERDGKIFAAVARVKKRVGNEWFDVAAVAYFDEYVQTDSKGQPVHMWRKMPRGQLAKCAEALALRKAFPAELSGIYEDAEMQQADAAGLAPQTASAPLAPEAAVPATSAGLAPVASSPETAPAGPAEQDVPEPEPTDSTVPEPAPGAPAKKNGLAGIKALPYEGQVIVAGPPEKKSRGWEAQGFDVLTDIEVTLVGPQVEGLQESQVLLVKGLRAETKSGIRVKVEELEPVSASAIPETAGPAPADVVAIAASEELAPGPVGEATWTVTLESAPKIGTRDSAGTLTRVAWAYARTSDGRRVVIAGMGDALDAIAGLAEGQVVEATGRLDEDSDKAVFYVRRVA